MDYWATVISVGDRTAVCEHDPFFEQEMFATVIAKIRARTERRPLAPSCGPPAPNAAAREAVIEYSFPRMIAVGARIVLGTDTGIQRGHTFDSSERVEIARWVQPGLKDLGTLAVGKRADFIVLDANPLDNIRNTRRISSVYLDGTKFDREAVLAHRKNANASH
jgi:hypothetical protein